eukprot:sb/3479187/
MAREGDRETEWGDASIWRERERDIKREKERERKKSEREGGEKMVNDISDDVLRKVLEKNHSLLTAPPFTHESLLTENKDQEIIRGNLIFAQSGSK